MTLTANVDDSATGGSNIASAVYTLDGGSEVPMSAADSSFDEVSEDVTASVGSFASSGIHEFCVHGTDAASNTGDPVCIELAVYDPSGGFVTGAGTITSPAGADMENPTLEGPATFAFVSKYSAGASTPDGNLRFRFKKGDLMFDSTSMDWLVVTAQPRAIFRGDGLINGETACKFEVNAYDGSLAPDSVDAFGLKIFACPGGNGRYNLPATPLTAGNIKIHQN